MAAEVIRSCKRHRSRSRKYFHSGGKHPLLTGCELAKLRLALIGANGLRELLPPRIDHLIEVTQDRAQIWTPRNISEKCLRRFTISVPTSILFKQPQTDHGSCDDTQCPRWNTGTAPLSHHCLAARSKGARFRGGRKRGSARCARTRASTPGLKCAIRRRNRCCICKHRSITRRRTAYRGRHLVQQPASAAGGARRASCCACDQWHSRVCAGRRFNE